MSGPPSSSEPVGPKERREELAANLADVRARLAAAEISAGRPPGSAALVVVTKTFPASDIRLLAGLGVGDVGESREPEASTKAGECADLDLRWHQVGQVQTNKAAAVARWAHVVHSLDRERLVLALDRGAQRAGRILDCYLQVSLAAAEHDPARAGAQWASVPALADAVAAAQGLRLVGLMGVAPVGVDARGPLEHLAQLSAMFRRDHPGADGLSAGMSGDLEEAVQVGATQVRVGRSVLGARPPLRYLWD